jgi:tetratricopeptide (TPR) repeat protein
MSDRLSKEELGRNELAEAVAHGIDFAEKHARQLVWAFVALLLGGLLVAGGWLWNRSRGRDASEDLTRALRVYGAEIVTSGARPDDPANPTFPSEQARRERAKELFTRLADRTFAPAAADLADLYLGEIAMVEGDGAAARRHWDRFVEAAGSTAPGMVAQLNLIQLDRAEGKGEELAARLESLLERPDGRQLPEDTLLYQLGITQQALGRTEQARATFRRLADEFPRSPLQAEARRLAGGGPGIG